MEKIMETCGNNMKSKLGFYSGVWGLRRVSEVGFSSWHLLFIPTACTTIAGTKLSRTR